jgi:hypothetical protein
MKITPLNGTTMRMLLNVAKETFQDPRNGDMAETLRGKPRT